MHYRTKQGMCVDMRLKSFLSSKGTWQCHVFLKISLMERSNLSAKQARVYPSLAILVLQEDCREGCELAKLCTKRLHT